MQDKRTNYNDALAETVQSHLKQYRRVNHIPLFRSFDDQPTSFFNHPRMNDRFESSQLGWIGEHDPAEGTTNYVTVTIHYPITKRFDNLASSRIQSLVANAIFVDNRPTEELEIVGDEILSGAVLPGEAENDTRGQVVISMSVGSGCPR